MPIGLEWLHEVKYTGDPVMVIREPDRVRLISRGSSLRQKVFGLPNAAAKSRM